MRIPRSSENLCARAPRSGSKRSRLCANAKNGSCLLVFPSTRVSGSESCASVRCSVRAGTVKECTVLLVFDVILCRRMELSTSELHQFNTNKMAILTADVISETTEAHIWVWRTLHSTSGQKRQGCADKCYLWGLRTSSFYSKNFTRWRRVHYDLKRRNDWSYGYFYCGKNRHKRLKFMRWTSRTSPNL